MKKVYLVPEMQSGPESPILPAQAAAKAIQEGNAPAGLRVVGHLKLAEDLKLTALPDGLTVDTLDVSGCIHLRELPRDLRASRLNISGCIGLERLPEGLQCYEIQASGTAFTMLPADLQVEYRLDLSNNTELRVLPEGLKVGTLNLSGCTALERLPEGLDVFFLDISGCTGLRDWPTQATLRFGRLNARGCTHLTTLPGWLRQVAQLDVSGCVQMEALPEGLEVTSWLDLANTGIRELPESLRGVQLRWRDVLVDERVVLRPETITKEDVLNAPNVELRRVLMERMGFEKFMLQARAEVLNTDRDPGGQRRLLRVPMWGDEPLVALSVFCPSTGRQYMLRVPPETRTCHQAAAWIAGFDNPDDYRPIMEA